MKTVVFDYFLTFIASTSFTDNPMISEMSYISKVV